MPAQSEHAREGAEGAVPGAPAGHQQAVPVLPRPLQGALRPRVAPGLQARRPVRQGRDQHRRAARRRGRRRDPWRRPGGATAAAARSPASGAHPADLLGAALHIRQESQVDKDHSFKIRSVT